MELGDQRNDGESNFNSGDGTGQMAQPWMFMMIMIKFSYISTDNGSEGSIFMVQFGREYMKITKLFLIRCIIWCSCHTEISLHILDTPEQRAADNTYEYASTNHEAQNHTQTLTQPKTLELTLIR
jgi:hypothetical protein